MGMYFNPGNESFTKDISGNIYVDKTGLLGCLNSLLPTPKNCIALSHARRFGKSQAAGMIDAYYSRGSDSRALFSKFEIAAKPDFEKHLNKYNVIHLDMSSVSDFFNADVTGEITRMLTDEFIKEVGSDINYSAPIHHILNEIYERTNARFVIIIDEWDCVVRNYPEEEALVHKYMQFLHSLFKSEESKRFLALGYITGILPIKKIKDESALNNFREFTMINSSSLTPYFGFTTDEVRTLCAKYGMDFESVKAWYDGYHISGYDMYNPNSVCEAMMRREIDSYWKNTSSFGTINDYITPDFDGLKKDVMKMIGGENIPVDVDTFQNDLSIIKSKDDALTALIHLGYLAYDKETGEARMPNFEVAKAYQAALKESGWNDVAASIRRCDELLKATAARDAATVAEIIELAHSAYASLLKYNDENALSCVITMAYFTAPAYYTIVRELPSGKGFADLTFLPHRKCSKPPMVIELKYDKTADSAINQIKERRYTDTLKGFVNKCGGDEILLVGISYNKRTKKHRCAIESISGL